MSAADEAGGSAAAAAPEPGHCLVVGGTGMLREVCLWLARRGHEVSVVGRRKARLDALVSRAEGLEGRVHPISVDYRETDSLAELLGSAIADRGTVQQAVCWVHSQSPEALRTVADAVASEQSPPRFIRVRGSAAGDPAAPDELTRDLQERSDLSYGEVILGFVLERGTSRWLDDEEISGGVIAALRSGAKRMVVGDVHRWDKKRR